MHACKNDICDPSVPLFLGYVHLGKRLGYRFQHVTGILIGHSSKGYVVDYKVSNNLFSGCSRYPGTTGNGRVGHIEPEMAASLAPAGNLKSFLPFFMSEHGHLCIRWVYLVSSLI